MGTDLIAILKWYLHGIPLLNIFYHRQTLPSKEDAWFWGSHIVSAWKVLGFIWIFKAWIMQFRKGNDVLQQGRSPCPQQGTRDKCQFTQRWKFKTVSHISLTCLSHTSIFAPLKIELRSNWKIRILRGHGGQPAQVDKNTEFSTKILSLFLPFFSIDCQTDFGAQQPFDLTHYGRFLIITNYFQNNENILVPQPRLLLTEVLTEHCLASKIWGWNNSKINSQLEPVRDDQTTPWMSSTDEEDSRLNNNLKVLCFRYLGIQKASVSQLPLYRRSFKFNARQNPQSIKKLFQTKQSLKYQWFDYVLFAHTIKFKPVICECNALKKPILKKPVDPKRKKKSQ